jgi:molybdate transport system substrate-binding protein
MQLRILSGGAAQGLVQAVAERFQAETGFRITGSFGAVGAMRDKLLAGEPADLLILTAGMLTELARDGHVLADTRADLGRVPTSLAVRSDQAPPAIDTAERLSTALFAAEAIYFPDPARATAGIHFAKVLAALGIDGELLASKANCHADGRTAMRALAASRAPRAIGCTQVSEILSTAGLTLLGPLPPPFELATVYTAGIARNAQAAAPARALIGMLTAPETAALRCRAGFEART